MTTMRKKSSASRINMKPLKETLEMAPLLQELSLLLYQKIRDLISRFNVLSASEGGGGRGVTCKRSLLLKASHHISELKKWKLSVFHTLNSLVVNTLSLATTRHQSPEVRACTTTLAQLGFDHMSRWLAIQEE